jgi:hypothetical protein
MPSTSKTKQQVQGYLFGVIPYDNIKSVFAEGPTIAEYTIWWRGTNSDDAILLGNQNGYHEEYPCWSLLPSFSQQKIPTNSSSRQNNECTTRYQEYGTRYGKDTTRSGQLVSLDATRPWAKKQQR